METLQARTEQAKVALRNDAPRIVRLQAQTGLALVIFRIQRDGLGKPYSTNLIPTFLFAKRALNASGRAYVKANKRGTWGQFRAAQGLPSSSVNLTYTGAMFRSLNVQGGASAGTQYSARVVAADAESAQKVAFNEQRYGDFLQPNASEAADVAAVGKKEIDKVIAYYLGPR